MMTRATASPPTRGRGLKRPTQRYVTNPEVVAPYAGAWIETQIKGSALVSLRRDGVAPYAGAWIETSAPPFRRPAEWCRPLRGGVD